MTLADRTKVAATRVVRLYSTVAGTKRTAIDSPVPPTCAAVIETKLPRKLLYTRCDARAKRNVTGLRGFSAKVPDPSPDFALPFCGRHANATMIRVIREEIS